MFVGGNFYNVGAGLCPGPSAGNLALSEKQAETAPRPCKAAKSKPQMNKTHGWTLPPKRWTFTFRPDAGMIEVSYMQQKGERDMLAPQELEKSPLFRDITYEEYQLDRIHI